MQIRNPYNEDRVIMILTTRNYVNYANPGYFFQHLKRKEERIETIHILIKRGAVNLSHILIIYLRYSNFQHSINLVFNQKLVRQNT
jgi:hypothetical protein